jgi:hypothetical protein
MEVSIMRIIVPSGVTPPVITSAPDTNVWVIDFAAAGLDGLYAFAVDDDEIGTWVIVDEQLDEATREEMANAVVAQLAIEGSRFTVVGGRRDTSERSL